MKGPWDTANAAALSAGTLVGLLVMVLAWWGASGSADLAGQARYLNVGVAGLIVADANLVVWLVAGRRAVGRRRRALLTDIAPVADPLQVARDDDDVARVSGPSMTRYHRTGCPLVVDKQVRAVRLGGRATARLRPCGICGS